MVSRKSLLALLPAILLNAAFIHLFLYPDAAFDWGNALRALFYALFLCLWSSGGPTAWR